MSHIQRAILSVTDKTGLVDFARKLSALDIELISTGGTAKLLRDSGIAVKDISDLTGFPEMLDGRVKTLHPKVHGGILHRRADPKHIAAIKEHDIQPIDMVVVNLYAFEKTAAKPGVKFEELIENIDIGGPSMIRSAAKNFHDVAIVTSPADYDAIADELQKARRITLPRNKVASRAKGLRHDRRLRFRDRLDARAKSTPTVRAPSAESFPATLRLSFHKTLDLRYGENPHQKAAMYSDGSGSRRRQRPPTAGQGTFLQQHRRPASRLGSRPGIRRARIRPASLRHHQAHQSLRHRDRQDSRPKPTSAPSNAIPSRPSVA